MTDLVTFAMQAAATELLQAEANQIDQEVKRPLAEMGRAPVEECRGGSTRAALPRVAEAPWQSLTEAFVIFEGPQSEAPRVPEPVKWATADFGFLGKPQRAGSR